MVGFLDPLEPQIVPAHPLDLRLLQDQWDLKFGQRGDSAAEAESLESNAVPGPDRFGVTDYHARRGKP